MAAESYKNDYDREFSPSGGKVRLLVGVDRGYYSDWPDEIDHLVSGIASDEAKVLITDLVDFASATTYGAGLPFADSGLDRAWVDEFGNWHLPVGNASWGWEDEP